MAGSEDVVLLDAPKDGITTVRFGPSGHLLATSWDTLAHVYDVTTNARIATLTTPAPLLDGTWTSATAVAVGGLDKTVRAFDMEASFSSVVAHHDGPVRCVEYSTDLSSLVTGSWDKRVCLWDVRKPADAPTSRIDLPERVYSMALCGPHTVIAATAGRHILLHDLRKMAAGSGGADSLLYARESQLKHQTRCVRSFVDGAGYMTGSIEGRCAVDYVDPAELASKKYAFKCHRVPIPGGEDRVFPVNALAFHPVFGTVVTGGGDGNVFSWDHKARKRLAAVKAAGTSIASLSYNREGTHLAIAASYTWEQGDRERPADAIFVHRMSDKEVNTIGPK